uniref:Uncharacterized protein n=1 Tax=Ditylenchus dipsaci TaxID=166011 RepID=A0A915EMQ1_9BILA
MLNLRKDPDGNGYLTNISLHGAPECEVKALFKYKQYKPLISGNPESLASDSLSTPAIVGISVGVVGAIAVLGLITFLLYCCLFKKEKKDEKEKVEPVVPKKEEQKQKQAVEGRAILDKRNRRRQLSLFLRSNQIRGRRSLQNYRNKASSLASPKKRQSRAYARGVPVGYRPEDCVRAVSLEKSLSPNTETRRRLPKSKKSSKNIHNGDLVGIGLKAEMAGIICIGQDSPINTFQTPAHRDE